MQCAYTLHPNSVTFCFYQFENLIVPSAQLNESYGTADKYFPVSQKYFFSPARSTAAQNIS